jgi:integrase
MVYTLAALTGLRRDDLVTRTWDEIDKQAITKRAAKRAGDRGAVR